MFPDSLEDPSLLPWPVPRSTPWRHSTRLFFCSCYCSSSLLLFTICCPARAGQKLGQGGEDGGTRQAERKAAGWAAPSLSHTQPPCTPRALRPSPLLTAPSPETSEAALWVWGWRP